MATATSVRPKYSLHDDYMLTDRVASGISVVMGTGHVETATATAVMPANSSSGLTGNDSLLNSAFGGDDGYFSNPDYHDPFDYTYVRVTFICLYSLVFCMCFVGNLIVLVVILKHRKMRTITNFFLANLAVADLCVGVFCVLPNLITFLSPAWVLGKVMCKLYYFVQSMSYTASINILTVISIERYFAIIHPIRSKQLTSICLLRATVVIVWVISACAGIPFLVYYNTTAVPTLENGTYYYCLANSMNMRAQATNNFVLWYLLPLFLMTVMYTRISVVLWHSSQGVGGSAGGGCRSHTGPSGGGGGAAAPRVSSSSSSGSRIGALAHGTNGHGNPCAAVVNEPYNGGGCGSGLDGDGRRHVPKVMTKSMREEQQCLVTSEDRRDRATRLLKRMDSNVSEDLDTGDNQGPTDSYESDHEDDWPTKNGCSGNKRAAIPMALITPSSRVQRINGTTMPNLGKDKKLIKSVAYAHPANSNPNNSGLQKLLKTSHKKKRPVENALLARRRVIRLLIVVIMSFAACVLPYHVRIMWLHWSAPHVSFWSSLLSPISFVIYYLNSGLNPLFYAFLSDRFRRCLYEVITCRDDHSSRYHQTSQSAKTAHSNV